MHGLSRSKHTTVTHGAEKPADKLAQRGLPLDGGEKTLQPHVTNPTVRDFCCIRWRSSVFLFLSQHSEDSHARNVLQEQGSKKAKRLVRQEKQDSNSTK